MKNKELIKKIDVLFEEYGACNQHRWISNTLGEESVKILEMIDDFPTCIPDSDKSGIVVSLTTIPERIDFVDIPIKCMLLQTRQVNKIVLWLDENKFSEANIPNRVLDLRKYGLDIRFVKDIGPHTKYLYAFKEYRNDCIVTIDDDIVYPRNLIERLWNAHEKNPKAVCGTWIWNMRVTRNGIPYPASDFKDVNFDSDIYTDRTFIAQGVGGVLYPPGCIDKKYLDAKLILSICPKADDVFMKAVEIMSGVEVVKANTEHLHYGLIMKTQEIALFKANQNGGNDDAIYSVFNYFPIASYFSDINKEENSKILLYSKWIEAHQKGLDIADYLKSRRMRSIAIYGLGRIGKLLLNELDKTDVFVKYGIDCRKDFLNLSIPVCTVDDDLVPVDGIIVTVSEEYNLIYESISDKIDCQIVTLEDLLAELLWAHRNDRF